MVRQDIISGLRNAMERGQSLDQAKQSLINSGYSSQDIVEAVNYVTGGLSGQPFQNVQNVNQQNLQSYQLLDNSQNKQVKTSPQTTQVKPYLQTDKAAQMKQDMQIQQIQQTYQMKTLNQAQPLQYITPQKQRSKFPWGLFILSVILLILVGFLVSSLLFKEEIITFLETLFG